MGDIAIVIAGIASREPDNKHAVEIRNYIVADNYLYGKAKLPSDKNMNTESLDAIILGMKISNKTSISIQELVDLSNVLKSKQADNESISTDSKPNTG